MGVYILASVICPVKFNKLAFIFSGVTWLGRDLKYPLIPALCRAGTAGTDQDAQSSTQPALGHSRGGNFKSV